MSNLLVRIITDDDGDKKEDAHVWHLVDPENAQGTAALCTDEFYGFGESLCTFKEKTVKQGGVTCPRCISIIKGYKAVKL